ncbi:radical SAM protein [Candidatus Pacearchaeota archaeon]|nr:radical SAM protein [Candidatus Pacearchaeota archaeon]
MKVMIAYPPIESEKGIPLLSQNRQFQFFNNPTYIFPVVPASAATLLKNKEYDVIWKDGIAENISSQEFYSFFEKEKPDLIAIETKTPVIKQQWAIVDKLKKISPQTKIVLMGDHVTALPEESLKNCKTDFILCGGDYDFMLLDLCEALSKKRKIPRGFWYRKGKKIVNTGSFQLKHNLDDLPFIDRELTKWHLYQKEYNIKGRPYMYIMSARDCPWHACKFCAWPVLFPKFRRRSVKNVLDEIGILIEKYHIKEIFDDAGTFPANPPYDWLKEFCKGMIERGYNKKILFSCNMRVDYLTEENAKLMKRAGFRLLKTGLESGNQKTLDRINKGIKVEQIKQACKNAKKFGLTIHLTAMVGWPWETKSEALNTFKLIKRLMVSGLADIHQCTIVVPYPGTQLHNEALKNHWFLIDPEDYEKYDMSQPILKTPMPSEEVERICNSIYKIFLTPEYIARRFVSIRNVDDLLFILRGVKAVLGHLKDFSR